MTILTPTQSPPQQQQKKQPKWAVDFPDKEHVGLYERPSLKRVCQGNERKASVLNFFLYEGSWEIERQKLEKGCKIVTFSCTHEEILQRLTFDLAKRSLISYLKDFNTCGYVTSEKFQKVYTVHFDKIQEAINNPPARKARKKRAKKECNDASLQPPEESVQDTENDATLHTKYATLQRKYAMLQPLVCNVAQLHTAFTSLVEWLQGHFPEDSIPSSILSLYSINTGESAQHLREAAQTHNGTDTPPALPDNVTLLSDSAKLRAAKGEPPLAVTPPTVPSWDEVDADVLKTTVKRQAAKGDAHAATSTARPGVAGISDNLPAYPGTVRDSGGADLAAHPAVHPLAAHTQAGRVVQRPAKDAPDASLTDACSGPLSSDQDGAASPRTGSTGSAASQPRASGASVNKPFTTGDAPPPTLTRKQQDRLIGQTLAAYWLVIEQWKGQKYSQTQRAQACHTSGLEAMYADGVTPDALTAKLKLLDDFQQRTFNVNRLYLEWWNNLDEAQPAKTNGKVSRGKPAPIERDAPVLAATGTDDLSAYGHSGFDVYKGNGPEERRRLAEIGAALPESYWE